MQLDMKMNGDGSQATCSQVSQSLLLLASVAACGVEDMWSGSCSAEAGETQFVSCCISQATPSAPPTTHYFPLPLGTAAP